MKAYHGTNKNFKNLDVNKTSEYGLYFADAKCFAEMYGNNIHTVELSLNNLCDLTTEKGIRTGIELLPELQSIIKIEEDLEELNLDELLEDELEACIYAIQKTAMNDGLYLENGDSVRDELLKAIAKAGYDSVKLEDYTDGDEHDAYVIFDNKNFKYAA